jgi:1-acyl-sn-glycerol-3-phosphate acyltransferase
MEALQERPLGKLLSAIAGGFLLLSLKGSLRGVYLKGEVPKGPLVLAMNHHSFFDGHLVWFLSRRERRSASLLVAEENLKAFPVLRLLGALEARRVREALRRLKEGAWVALFPEGEMRYPGPLGPLKPGATWLARKAVGFPSSPWPAGWPSGGLNTPRPFSWWPRPFPRTGTWKGR